MAKRQVHLQRIALFIATKLLTPSPALPFVGANRSPLDKVRLLLKRPPRTQGRILTFDKLQTRGWRILNRCYMCKKEEALCKLLRLHCSIARILWQLIFSLFRVAWVMHSSIRGTLLSCLALLWGRSRRNLKGSLPCVRYRPYRRKGIKGHSKCRVVNSSNKILLSMQSFRLGYNLYRYPPMTMIGFVVVS